MNPGNFEILKLKSTLKAELPDVSHEQKADVEGELDRVGMSNVEMPIKLKIRPMGTMVIPAKCDVFVNLIDSKSKGIHMSRLYLSLQEALMNEELNLSSLEQLLNHFVVDQEGISNESSLRFSFNLPVQRKALVSNQKGWRQYPVWVKAALNQKTGVVNFTLGGEVLYSSTCPCSAALSRKMIQDQFKNDFDAESIEFDNVLDWLGDEKSASVTPHAQRSLAKFSITLEGKQIENIDWLYFIDLIEGVLKTPVQAAVKREDEQEFARLNGENLMFCEDAARRIKSVLESEKNIKRFNVKVSHKESLHPHDATAYASGSSK